MTHQSTTKSKEVTFQYEQEGQIGGTSKIIEVNATEIGKRKYEHGRAIDGHWIVDRIERNYNISCINIC